jgi:hypothetical protein
MASSGARRVEVPDEFVARPEPSRSAYASAFEAPIGARKFLTPGQWARATFEGATVVLATLVQFSGRAGRVQWAVATPIHNRVIPYLLGRARN